jgi:hypothetical protein
MNSELSSAKHWFLVILLGLFHQLISATTLLQATSLDVAPYPFEIMDWERGTSHIAKMWLKHKVRHYAWIDGWHFGNGTELYVNSYYEASMGSPFVHTFERHSLESTGIKLAKYREIFYWDNQYMNMYANVESAWGETVGPSDPSRCNAQDSSGCDFNHIWGQVWVVNGQGTNGLIDSTFHLSFRFLYRSSHQYLELGCSSTIWWLPIDDGCSQLHLGNCTMGLPSKRLWVCHNT